MKKKSTHASVRYGVVALCAALLLRCGPLPTKPGEDVFALQLGLEDGTKTAATFSGEPIAATITLPDSVEFDSIAWHCGSGQMAHPGVAPSLRSKNFNVQLFWTSNPLCKDTVTKRLFDTVYVSTHGETKHSNSVKVTVTNVPPVIDSVRIGTTTIKNSGAINYVIPSTDTSTYILLRVGASDANLDPLRYDWFSSGGVTLSPAALVSYGILKYQFADTIVVTVYDGKGGSAEKTIILSKPAPDHPPVIDNPPRLDSIRVNGVMQCRGAAVVAVDSGSGKDTFVLRVFASDPDKGDTVKLSVKAKKPSQLTMLSDTTVQYACRDSIYNDTVAFMVKDLSGDSAKKNVVIAVVNRLPRIDSITVQDTVKHRTLSYASSDSLVMGYDSIATADSVKVSLFAHDPDAPRDSIAQVKWTLSSGKSMKLLDKKGLVVQYPGQSAAGDDTVTVMVADIKQKMYVKSLIFGTR